MEQNVRIEAQKVVGCDRPDEVKKPVAGDHHPLKIGLVPFAGTGRQKLGGLYVLTPHPGSKRNRSVTIRNVLSSIKRFDANVDTQYGFSPATIERGTDMIHPGGENPGSASDRTTNRDL